MSRGLRVGYGAKPYTLQAPAIKYNYYVPPTLPKGQGSGSGNYGFTPAPGFSYQGIFGNYQNFKLFCPGGGLVAKSPALPLALYWFGENGSNTYSTDPIYSVNSTTLTKSSGALVGYQTSNLPGGATQAALVWTPFASGQNDSGSQTCFGSDTSTASLNITGGYGSQLYMFRKYNMAMSAMPDNIKTFRGWPTSGFNHPDCYLDYNSTPNIWNMTIEAGPAAVSGLNQAGGAYDVSFLHPKLNTWITDEMYWQECSASGNVDGIFNYARNGQLGFALAGRWCNRSSSLGDTAYTRWYFDEFTSGTVTHVPNGSTDVMYYGFTAFDINFLQSLTSPESPYSTAQAGKPINSALDMKREFQIQTLRTDTEVDYFLRRGEQLTGTPYNLYVLTGYGTSVYAGQGVWQS